MRRRCLPSAKKNPSFCKLGFESTMEAVEETIGAKSFSRECSLAPLCCAAIYFSVTELERCL